jgi:hypothetical protein
VSLSDIQPLGVQIRTSPPPTPTAPAPEQFDRGTGAPMWPYPAPVIDTVVPSAGPADTPCPVTLTGQRFTAVTGVLVGDTPATLVVVVSDTEITATLPAMPAGWRPVYAITAWTRNRNGVPFEYTATSGTAARRQR